MSGIGPARAASTPASIRVGVSSCLLGQAVRYDGGHKRDRYLTDVLGDYFEFVPFCPEVAAGLGTPRPPIRLVGDPERARAVGVRDTALDATDALHDASSGYLDDCAGLAGYVVKRGSPSCGMERVKIYDPDTGMPAGRGPGLFTARLQARMPLLPVEEEGRLNDPILRENFVTRVFALHRWQTVVATGLTRAKLTAFHARHKYLLFAHDEAAMRALGRLLAEPGVDAAAIGRDYVRGFMSALSQRATRKRHANVLGHLAGHLKRSLDGDDRRELAEVIERYRAGKVPLVVPLTLLAHHFRRHPDPYVASQHYLDPHPHDLMLRNAV